MYTPKYDLALVDDARNGDKQAILALLDLAQPDIRRYARRSCSASDDVDDVVQETLWLLYRRVGTLRALGSISGWLLAVVRRECLRMAMRALGKPDNLDDALPNPANVDRLAHLSQDDLRLDLSRAIQSLPEHYREVIILRDIEEMTIDEIAASLNLTRESIKGRLHRSWTLLREYLLD
ncbi:sigma-70 family RNA polymerase sigma factor [Mesorhizobium sp.]|uniref:RNA polymerase sigma factor n=1 Tax=Mesorhizobium sp. TaxID=1871066 RepID=UPI00122869F0|nr:sigma-70 family RNA polymerase sigma factor [Mesorhizobium sp.]TIX23699.1 MAG: sigma-70 family RNA polymerase sigma factor [Mesorhizobium sp.]